MAKYEIEVRATTGHNPRFWDMVAEFERRAGTDRVGLSEGSLADLPARHVQAASLTNARLGLQVLHEWGEITMEAYLDGLQQLGVASDPASLRAEALAEVQRMDSAGAYAAGIRGHLYDLLDSAVFLETDALAAVERMIEQWERQGSNTPQATTALRAELREVYRQAQELRRQCEEHRRLSLP